MVPMSVINKLIADGELVVDSYNFPHRPEPTNFGKTSEQMMEYSRYIEKCRKGWCPICESATSEHAPRCVIGQNLIR